MQRVPKQTRKVNRWNAYLHSQVQAFNKGLSPTEPRPRMHVISKSIRERWDAMTEEERVAATEDAVVELEDLRESKQAARKESKISSSRDIRSTMDSIETELLDLNTRTGAEVLMIQIRPEPENFSNKPRIFLTSSRIGEFFQLSTQRSVQDFAVKLQAFCVADIRPHTQTIPSLPEPSTPTSVPTAIPPPAATVVNMQQQVIDMKRKVKTTINEKLQECAYPIKIPRINYMAFETSISERHGIVCENWPLPNFCAPGSLNSLTELEVLYHAWSTGVTSFRKMSAEEHQQFKEARVQRRLQAAIAQANAAALAAQRDAPVVRSPGAGSSSAPMPQPSTPDGSSSPGAVSQIPVDTQEPVTVDPSPAPMHPPRSIQSSASPSAGVDAQPSTSPVGSSTALPEQSPMASSSAVTFESLSSPGPSTFVFSTGKRPPPSQYNILGPMGLASKKPRKKRAGAGLKRGPNKRTKNAHPNAEVISMEVETPEEEEEGGVEEEQQRQTPTAVNGEAPEEQVPPDLHGQPSASSPQIQCVIPDPGGTTSVFRVQAQPPTQSLVPRSNAPQAM